MPTLVLFLFRFARLVFSGHAALAVENAALRLQLDAFRRKRKRPVLTSVDRLFWVTLSLLWKGWCTPLIYVRADTVVRWQRERFRRFWARISTVKQRRRGRPVIPSETQRLIERMVAANPLWRPPEFTASCNCSASKSPNVPSLASFGDCRGRPARPGRPSCTIISARWFQSISSVRPKGVDHQWGKDPLK
jgi:hypothetical protein